MLLEPFYVTLTLPPYRGPCDTFECGTASLAKLRAGELLAEHFEQAPLVLVYRREWVQDGKTTPPRKWHAKLTPEHDVRLELAGEDTPGETRQVRDRDRLARYARHKARVAQRRQRRKTAEQVERDREREDKAAKFTNGIAQAVVCLDPLLPFPHISAAAKWAGVSRPVMSRAVKKGYAAGRFRFAYARTLLKELEDEQQSNHHRANHAAIRQVAEHALSLRIGQEVQALSRAAPAEAGGAAGRRGEGGPGH